MYILRLLNKIISKPFAVSLTLVFSANISFAGGNVEQPNYDMEYADTQCLTLSKSYGVDGGVNWAKLNGVAVCSGQEGFSAGGEQVTHNQAQYQAQAQYQSQSQYQSQYQYQAQGQYQSQYQYQAQSQYQAQMQYQAQSQYQAQMQYQAQAQYQAQMQYQYQYQNQMQYQYQNQMQYQGQYQAQYASYYQAPVVCPKKVEQDSWSILNDFFSGASRHRVNNWVDTPGHDCTCETHEGHDHDNGGYDNGGVDKNGG